MGQNPEAGWAPDPYRRHEQRWWDGHQWTDDVLVHGETKLDPIAFAVVPPGAHLGAPESSSAAAADESAGAAQGEDAGASGPVWSRSTRGRVVLAALLLGLASLAVGATLGGGDVVPPVPAMPEQATGSVPAPAGGRTPSGPAGVALANRTAPGAGTLAGPTTGSTPGETTVGGTGAAASPTWPTSADVDPTWGAPVTDPDKAPARVTTPEDGPTSATSTEEPAPTTSAEPEPKDYANCRKMHADFPHGAGLPGAVDDVRDSQQPVTDFVRDRALYQANADLDRDDDAIACEA